MQGMLFADRRGPGKISRWWLALCFCVGGQSTGTFLLHDSLSFLCEKERVFLVCPEAATTEFSGGFFVRCDCTRIATRLVCCKQPRFDKLVL